MAHLIDDDLLICDDCACVIANGDYSGVDPADETRVRAGVSELNQRGYPVVNDEYGFSWRPCECCGGLAGNRSHAAILGD
jgi:hypothetical protein